MTKTKKQKNNKEKQREMMIAAAVEIGLTQDEAEDAVDIFGRSIRTY